MEKLGALLIGVSVSVLLIYGLGAIERRRWGGKVPTIAEYMRPYPPRAHKSSIMQLQAARIPRQVAVLSVVALVLGTVLLFL